MLLEGLYLEIKISDGSYRVCKLNLVEKFCQCINVDIVDSSKHSIIPLSKIFIIRICSVEIDTEDDTIFHIECDDGSNFDFKTPDMVDTEAMIAGLQVIQMNNRQLHTRSLKRGFSVLIAFNNYYSLDSAFYKWKRK